MTKTKYLLFSLVLVSIWSVPCWANDAEKEEAARQQAFQSGVQRIVDDLNAGSTDAFVGSIDHADLLDRVFGLRLIDQRVKKEIRKGLPQSFLRYITSSLPGEDETVKATLLGVESRGDRGRAVVRFDYPKFKFNYHEYDLRLRANHKVIIHDWIDFLDGSLFTEAVGQSMVMAAPGKAATRKLLDFRNVSETELFQFAELLKAARDRKMDRYLEIREGMQERFQRQRIVVETNVHLARQTRKRRQMVAGLAIMARYYPEEPLYSLMLLDYYVPARRLDEAIAALERLVERLDIVDAATEARLSAAALDKGDLQDASARADVALSLEDDLELAWWSALKARVALEDFVRATEALQQLEAQFGWDLGTETLQQDKSYRTLLASSEYQAWLETR